jgi:hypothetical protein
MFIENLIRRHKNAYSIGEKIIQNMNHKNNFFYIPPPVYTGYSHDQEVLLKRLLTETEQINEYWRENKKYMKLYVLQPNNLWNT